MNCVFITKIPGTDRPYYYVPLFKKFQENWSTLDKTKYKDGLAGNKIPQKLLKKVGETNAKVHEFLCSILPRDDYKELLELCQIFLGTMDVEKVKFYKPGAFHHARWMSKAIYTLKIYIFRDIYELDTQLKKNLLDICLFIVFIYVPFWFAVPRAALSPNLDLQFLKVVYQYRTIDKKISEAVLHKLKNHLWYLNSETAALSFFDPNVPASIKNKMVIALKNCEDSEFDSFKRYIISTDGEIKNLENIDFFINSNSLKIFDRFDISKDFLETNADTWISNDIYLNGLAIVNNLQVVNYVAERAVQLTQDYINRLTTQEGQKQYLIQVVCEYRAKYLVQLKNV